MESFQLALNAVVPFLCCVFFGWLAERCGWVSGVFFEQLNQMTFRCFFPLLAFYNLYSIRGKLDLELSFVIVCSGAVLISTAVGVLLAALLTKENCRRGVIVQAVFRSNALLFALPLAESIFGAQGAALASLLITFIVPGYNILAVLVLETYRGHKAELVPLLKKTLSNPLIAGTLAAMLFIGLGLQLPAVLEKPISQFSGMTSPLALFALGGTLKLPSIKNNARTITAVILVKMILLPIVFLALSIALGMQGVERFLFLSLFFTPVAASSYPMAQNMGGDGDLAGELVLVSTIASLGILFAWIVFLNHVHLL